MSVYTDYDEKRDGLRERLEECLEKARVLLDKNICGYKEIRKDYGLDVYLAVKKALEIV